MSDATKKAKKLLAAATPGPWTVYECPKIRGLGIGCGQNEGVLESAFFAPADAALIAASPELIATLCSETEAAEARAEVMSGLLVDLRDYVARSDGIAGFHLNGSLAPWGETGLTVEAIDAAVAADAARPHLTRAFTAEAERDALLAKCSAFKFRAVKAEAVVVQLRSACTQASAFLASCNGLPDAAGELRHVLWKAIALKVENPLLEDALVKSDDQPKQTATLTSRQAQIIRDLFYKICDDFLGAVEWAGFKDPSEVEDAFDALEDIAGYGET